MISTPCGQYAGSKARRILHEQLLQSIIEKSIYFFQITPFGRLMNRFSLDMAVIDKVNLKTIFYFSSNSMNIFPHFSFEYRKLRQQVNVFYNLYYFVYVQFY